MVADDSRSHSWVSRKSILAAICSRQRSCILGLSVFKRGKNAIFSSTSQTCLLPVLVFKPFFFFLNSRTNMRVRSKSVDNGNMGRVNSWAAVMSECRNLYFLCACIWYCFKILVTHVCTHRRPKTILFLSLFPHLLWGGYTDLILLSGIHKCFSLSGFWGHGAEQAAVESYAHACVLMINLVDTRKWNKRCFQSWFTSVG